MKIIKSKSKVHKEFGYPIPQILCAKEEDIAQAIEEWKHLGIDDAYVIDYVDPKEIIDKLSYCDGRKVLLTEEIICKDFNDKTHVEAIETICNMWNECQEQ